MLNCASLSDEQDSFARALWNAPAPATEFVVLNADSSRAAIRQLLHFTPPPFAKKRRQVQKEAAQS